MPTYYSQPHLYNIYKPKANTNKGLALELSDQKIPFRLWNGHITIGSRREKLHYYGDIILIDNNDLPSGIWGVEEDDEYHVISEEQFNLRYEKYIDGYFIEKNPAQYSIQALCFNESKIILNLMLQEKIVIYSLIIGD